MSNPVNRHLAAVAVLLMGICSVPAHAQLTVAGNLSFSQTGYTLSKGYDSTLPRGMAFAFAPQLSIPLGERVAVGLRAGISNSIYTYSDGYYDRDRATWKTDSEDEQTLMKASGALFLRLRCAQWDKLSLHIEFSCGYSYGVGVSTKTEYRILDGSSFKIRRKHTLGQIELKAVPVVSLALSHHVGMDFYADLLSIAYRSTTTNYMLPINISETGIEPGEVDYSATTNNFEAGLQSLSATLLSVGFYYRF